MLRRSFFYAFFKLKQLIYIYFIYKTVVLRHAALEITVIQQSSFSDCSSTTALFRYVSRCIDACGMSIRQFTVMTQDNPLMQHSITCPKCGSTQVEKRNHEQNLQKIGGVLLGSAGTAAGTVGGAASGASTWCGNRYCRRTFGRNYGRHDWHVCRGN